ncbi:hypothetical protein B0E54_04662 [Micromonospora sp. MH99]|nr:hypothetical protein [Micromonospora sp. MH99]
MPRRGRSSSAPPRPPPRIDRPAGPLAGPVELPHGWGGASEPHPWVGPSCPARGSGRAGPKRGPGRTSPGVDRGERAPRVDLGQRAHAWTGPNEPHARTGPKRAPREDRGQRPHAWIGSSGPAWVGASGPRVGRGRAAHGWGRPAIDTPLTGPPTGPASRTHARLPDFGVDLGQFPFGTNGNCPRSGVVGVVSRPCPRSGAARQGTLGQGWVPSAAAVTVSVGRRRRGERAVSERTAGRTASERTAGRAASGPRAGDGRLGERGRAGRAGQGGGRKRVACPWRSG